MNPRHDLRAVLGPMLAEQPLRLAMGAALATLTVLTGMGLLGLSGWFITATSLAGLQAATALGFDVFVPSAGIRLLALGRTGSRYAERLVTHDATFAALANLRVRLFRQWAGADAARTLVARPSRLLFRLTADIDALETVYLRLLVPAGAAFGAALLAGVVLGLGNVLMGVVLTLWLIGIGVILTLRVGRGARRPAMLRAKALEVLRARTTDLVAGQVELAMTGSLERQCEAIVRADRQLVAADLALDRLHRHAGIAFGMSSTLALAAALIGVGVLVEQASLTAPAAMLILLMVLASTEPFTALRRGALESGRAWLAARRLAPVETDEPTGPMQPFDADCAMRLTQVDACHAGARSPVLHDIDLTLNAGARVAVIGASGSGKSTLLRVIAGELAPRSGSVRVQSHSLLTQRTELFNDSLRDNLRLADAAASDVRLDAALWSAGLSDDVQAMPSGLATVLGEGGIGLSGGQASRLALARLLLRDVRVWLLDEPTDALDAATAHDVLFRLDTEAVGRTLLIATHLRREAALADRLIGLREGRIVADLARGTTAFDTALNALRPD